MALNSGIFAALEISFVNRKATPPLNCVVSFRFDTRAWHCPVCMAPILTIEMVEDYISDPHLAATGILPEWEGCKDCGLDLEVKYNGEVFVFAPRTKNPQISWPWVMAKGIWFECEDNLCPLCNNKLGEKDCHCGVIILPQTFIDMEFGLPDKMNNLYQAYGGQVYGGARGGQYMRGRRYNYNEPRKNSEGKWMAKASLIWDNIAQVYKFEFDWVGKDFIEVMKKTIPASDRAYEPKTKKWFVSEHGFQICKLLIETLFTHVSIQDRATVEAKWNEFQFAVAPVNTNKELNTFLELLTKAGIPFPKDSTDGKLAVKAYRKAAMFLHPDRNPHGAEDMSKLNAAFRNLEEYFGLKKQLT